MSARFLSDDAIRKVADAVADRLDADSTHRLRVVDNDDNSGLVRDAVVGHDVDGGFDNPAGLQFSKLADDGSGLVVGHDDLPVCNVKGSHAPEGRGGWGRVGIALLGGIVLGAVVTLAGFATAAHAGSDSPTPYTVDADGVTLPAGVSFPAHGHVNLVTSVGGKGVHFDPNNGHPGGAWIGKSFIPWSAFGLVGCDSVSWVQIHGFNEHYGEGGQVPVVVGPCAVPEPTPMPERTVTPAPEPTPEITPEQTSEPSVVPVLAETGAADGIFWLLGVCTVILGGLLVAIRAVAVGSKPRYKRGA